MEGPAGEIVTLGLVALAAPLAIIAIITWVLQYFVALRSPPTKRAASTTALGYVLASVLLTSSLPPDMAWAVPLTAIPGAVIVFFWWRAEFRAAWIEASVDLPEGVEMANDDWRSGLILVVGVLGFVALRTLIRLVRTGQL